MQRRKRIDESICYFVHSVVLSVKSYDMQTKSSVYHELIEAMAQPGCAVCRLIDRAVRQYVDVFFYENITTVERRREIREARGYCSVHGSMLTGHSRMLGAAIVHQDVINDVVRELNKTLGQTEVPSPKPNPKKNTRKPQALDDLTSTPLRNAALNAIQPKRLCPLCEDRARPRDSAVAGDHRPHARAADANAPSRNRAGCACHMCRWHCKCAGLAPLACGR